MSLIGFCVVEESKLQEDYDFVRIGNLKLKIKFKQIKVYNFLVI